MAVEKNVQVLNFIMLTRSLVIVPGKDIISIDHKYISYLQTIKVFSKNAANSITRTKTRPR